jgi:hypothetical protein
VLSRVAQNLLAALLLIPWFALWIKSFIEFHFATRKTWVAIWPHMGLDIMYCVYAVRALARGTNPLVADIGDFRGPFAAPPVLLPLFAWTRWSDVYMATLIWAIAIALIVGRAAYVAVQTRRALGLWQPTTLLAVVTILWSMPVLLSMERGSVDAWVLVALLLAMPLMSARRWFEDVLAGFVLAVGAWTKIYPGLLVFGLPGLCRLRVVAAMALGIVLIGVVPLEHTKQFFRNAAGIQDANRVAPLQEAAAWVRDPTFEQFTGEHRALEYFGHSLVTFWPMLFGRTFLGSVPGLIGAGALLGPLLLYGTYEVWRSPRRSPLFYPYALWVVAVGTYGLPISYDYNLLFIPLAALALWDHRDPIWVHLLMLLIVIWWQPMAIAFTGETYIVIKMLSLIPLTILLVRRAREAPPTPLTTRVDASADVTSGELVVTRT